MIEATFVHPVLISFGGFNLYSYGLMVALALATCTIVCSREFTRLKIDAEASTFMLSFIPGFWFGSKMQMVLSAYLSGEPMPHLGIDTGHSFMGSAVGGVLCAALYGHFCNLTFLRLLDLITPLVPLGHAIGKWGCFLAGDGCYGPPAPDWLPWAMSFPRGGVPVKVAVHPTPLYESALSFALFAYFHFGLSIPAPGDKRELPVGRRAAFTLALYGIERMVIEPWRRHPASEYLWGLTEYQFLAVIFVLLGCLISLAGTHSEPWPRIAAGKVEGKKEKKKAKAA